MRFWRKKRGIAFGADSQMYRVDSTALRLEIPGAPYDAMPLLRWIHDCPESVLVTLSGTLTIRSKP